MGIFLLLRKWLRAWLLDVSNRNLYLLFLAYVTLTWVLLSIAGEHELTGNFSTFFYYLIVTASTVGYGDLSPHTALGKWVVVMLVIPGGLVLFAAALGRLSASAIESWRAGILGKRRVEMNDHILILGWHGERTVNLIRMLQHEEAGKRPIVLCVRAELENPLPGEVEFVRVSSFTDDIEMSTGSYTEASCIIIDVMEDDLTLSAALFCSNHNPTAHILAYFNDESLSQLLRKHCSNVECIPSISTEMLAKSAVDPGSSLLHQELLSSTKGMTQYSVTYPEVLPATSVEPIFHYMKRAHQATLIALDSGDGILLNPDLACSVTSGAKLFYIADERIEKFDWKSM